MSERVEGYHEKAKVGGKAVYAIFLPNPSDRSTYIERYRTDAGKMCSDYTKRMKDAVEQIKYHKVRYG